MALIAHRTPRPGDVGGRLATLALPYTALLPVAERADLVAKVIECLRSSF
jgi:hypothetical protein